MYGYETFHEDLMKNLIESVHNGASSHAYIFEGEKGLGVLNSARLFAAALTCKNTGVAPCGSCQNCVESKADTNPDIIYVRPKADKKSIGAKDMRKLEEDVAVKPFNSKHKVYIFEDASLLTEEAQNTFLKTFEEPPEYAVFILITENSASLLQTILSRFTLVHFPSVSDAIMEKYISGKYPEEKERLPFLIKYCAGVPGVADNIINDENFESVRTSSLENLFSVLSTDRSSAFVVKKYLDENKDKAENIFVFWLAYLRDIILMQSQAPNMIINIDKNYYTSKEEAKKHMGMMSNVVSNNIVDLDLSEIVKRVGKKGCTFTRAIVNGATRDERFVQQRFLVLDFDGTIEMEVFKKRCEEYRVPFLFTYKTLSWSEECNRFRAVFLMDRWISNPELAKAANYMLDAIFPESDSSCVNLGRMLLGGKGVIEKNLDARINVVELAREVETYYRVTKGRNYSTDIKNFGKKSGIKVSDGEICIFNDAEFNSDGIEDKITDNAKDLDIHVINAQTALGKTEQYAEIVKNQTDKKFLIAASTIKLQHELAERIEAKGVKCEITESIYTKATQLPFPGLTEELDWAFSQGFAKRAKRIVSAYRNEHQEELSAEQ